MARPSNEFVLAWSSLTTADTDPGWQAIALPSAGPLQLRAGRRSPENAEAVLVGFPSARLAAADKLPEGQGFSVERADPDGDDWLWLALTRKPAGRPELFESMACDVIGALDDSVAAGSNEGKLLRIFVGRVAAWQEFMRKGAQTLSPEAEIGLFGELSVLRSILESGVAPLTALEAWVGPIDGLQDFTLGTGAIEVKATLSTTGFPARIGSLEQLDDSTRQPLFVAGVRLLQSETGASLPSLVEDLRKILHGDAESTRIVGERLLAAGYYAMHANNYIRRFTVLETRLIPVEGAFPRLTHGTVPTGITRVTYEVELDKVVGISTDMPNVLKKLGAL